MFKRIDSITASDPNVNFTVEVSFMEIYNEQIKDLLNPANNKKVGIKVQCVCCSYFNMLIINVYRVA